MPNMRISAASVARNDVAQPCASSGGRTTSSTAESLSSSNVSSADAPAMLSVGVPLQRATPSSSSLHVCPAASQAARAVALAAPKANPNAPSGAGGATRPARSVFAAARFGGALCSPPPTMRRLCASTALSMLLMDQIVSGMLTAIAAAPTPASGHSGSRSPVISCERGTPIRRPPAAETSDPRSNSACARLTWDAASGSFASHSWTPLMASPSCVYRTSKNPVWSSICRLGSIFR
ncbi:hypothetical protein BE20_39685 [Sorangium cellulosum]|nr:hypothetical protein BE20_39685 [Sorangium cellulosum]